jgi:hypothetical protein
MTDDAISPPLLVAIEYVVDDLDRALEVLVDLMGFEIVQRGPHPTLDAEQVLVDAGPVSFSLLHPTADGDRMAIVEPFSNPAQLIFTLPDDRSVGRLATAMSEAGASVMLDDPSTFHLSAQATESIFGRAPSFVITASGQ